MFYSVDLLSKRDSGFGLLWLAATLGSKSAFKKLPKRSVMTADISQLCRLIATPTEPLALRLSSNLLVGAARVYRVKQEIFISDVTTCFNSLKRVEHEFRTMTSSEGQLQMAQPSVKSSAVTMRADPRAVFSIEFDAMVTSWDEYLNLGGNMYVEDDSVDDYCSTTKKGKTKPSSALASNTELIRATACTLPENHDFLLANSFDASFGGSALSSSQIGGFVYDDTFDGLDIAEGLGDDLVRELGEGWGVSPIKDKPANDLPQVQEILAINFDVWHPDDGEAGLDELLSVVQDPRPRVLDNLIQSSGIDSVSPHTPSLATAIESVDFQTFPFAFPSPSFKLAIGQMGNGVILPENYGVASRKAKRKGPMMDARTELTDEELKAIRAHYLEKQNNLRCEMEFKRFEKSQDALIHNLLWDAPSSVHAKELVDFWVNHFKAHVEARSGLFVEPQHPDSTPPQKRRKVYIPPPRPAIGDTKDSPAMASESWRHGQDVDILMGGGDLVDFNYDTNVNWGEADDHTPNAKNLRSSEEPGQARHTSAVPALGDNLGVDVVSDTFHSQRSALFPWDMAGSSSSVLVHGAGIELPINNPPSVERADVRLRGSSASRRGSSLPSLPNLQAGTASPAITLPAFQSDDDFVFDVPGGNHAHESREYEANHLVLEKNSHNFLEYAKMQYKSLPSAQYLVLDDVAPKMTSTARVAATALYHCLVLATKNLLQVNQEEPYGRIDIRIK